jgi:hypothetical protein
MIIIHQRKVSGRIKRNRIQDKVMNRHEKVIKKEKKEGGKALGHSLLLLPFSSP